MSSIRECRNSREIHGANLCSSCPRRHQPSIKNKQQEARRRATSRLRHHEGRESSARPRSDLRQKRQQNNLTSENPWSECAIPQTATVPPHNAAFSSHAALWPRARSLLPRTYSSPRGCFSYILSRDTKPSNGDRLIPNTSRALSSMPRPNHPPLIEGVNSGRPRRRPNNMATLFSSSVLVQLQRVT